MDKNLKRSIILEHYQNPHNKGLVDDDSYIKINMNTESCIDNINIQLKMDRNFIKDIRFDGEACAISTSSTSIMINSLIGKTKEEALEIYDNFVNMIDEKAYNKDILEEANAYEDIYLQSNRKKCALLPWKGLYKLLKEEKK